MSLLCEDEFRKLENQVQGFNDMASIMGKLKSNGYLDSLYDIIFQIFSSEYQFTMKTLHKMQEDNITDGYGLTELYSANSFNFLNNFQVILKLATDSIFSKFTILNKQQKLLEQQKQKISSAALISPLSSDEPRSLMETMTNKWNKQYHSCKEGKHIELEKSKGGINSENSFIVKQEENDDIEIISQEIRGEVKQQMNKMQIESLNCNLNYIKSHHPTLEQIEETRKQLGRSSSQGKTQTRIFKQQMDKQVDMSQLCQDNKVNKQQFIGQEIKQLNKHKSMIELSNSSNQPHYFFNDKPTPSLKQSEQFQQQEQSKQAISQILQLEKNNSNQFNDSNSTATLNNLNDKNELLLSNPLMFSSPSKQSNKQQLQLRYYQNNLLNNINSYSHSSPIKYQNSSSSKVQKDTFHSQSSIPQMRQSLLTSSDLLNNNNSQISQGLANQSGFSFSQPLIELQGEGGYLSQSLVGNNSGCKVYLPYSEFSYTKGGKFSKSERKLHQIADTPGVGEYVPFEKGKFNQSAKTVFGKSQKKTIFSKKTDYQGSLYYPSYHFVSKSPPKY